MAHLRAALVLLTWALLLVLGTPGLDFLDARTLRSAEDQAAWRARMGEPWETAGLLVTTVNREWRLPVASALTPLQRPFRVSQEWFLYRDGPSKVRRLEVRVDGELRHRSADPAYPWLAEVLRNRRIRPVVESTCTSENGANWKGLGRLIVARARAEWPEASAVELACTVAPFPSPGAAPVEAKVHHRYVASAPTWKVAPG